MNVVSGEHKATLCQWYEELQERCDPRVNPRRSATLNGACLSEGFHSLMVQTHSLWNTQGGEWRFTVLALAAVLAAQVETIDDRQTLVVQLGQKAGDTPVMSRSRSVRPSAVRTPDELPCQLRCVVSLLHDSVNPLSLAEGTFRQCHEQDDLLNHRRRQQRPIGLVHIHWTLDYYQVGDAE